MWAGGKRENIFFTNPNHEESDEQLRRIIDLGYKDILLADCSISYNFARQIDIEYEGLNIELLDHHKTAIPLSEFKWCTIDINNSECGSKMLFHSLGLEHTKWFPDGLMFIDAVDSHDRWTKKIPDGETYASLHAIYGQKMFIDRFVGSEFAIKPEETFLLDLEEKKLQELITEKKKTIKIVNKVINGKNYKFGCIGGAAKYVSRLSEALYADEKLNLDVVVCVGAEAVSLRADRRKDVDVSEIAKCFGGGGHKSASGFVLDNILGSSLIDFVINKMEF